MKDKQKLPLTLDELKTFWSEKASTHIDWIKPWDSISEGDFLTGAIEWFKGGKLNVSANCLDRHLPDKANHPAIIWEDDTEHRHRTLTFAQLHEEVCKMANVLKSLGISKGDRIGIYLPMIPEAAIAMLACTRIGAVHTVIFAGFSPAALKQRLQAAEARLLITADSYERGGKHFPLLTQADEATHDLDIKTLVIKHGLSNTPVLTKNHYWWHELGAKVTSHCDPEPMDAEDPLFILYTSGSTGQPKGLIHTTGGYLVQVAYSHQHIFNCQPNDIFWCTADVGWITGHSYVVYGPLCNGITSLIFAGIPTWPSPARCWQIVDKHKVSVFYTAPTAIRALKRAGDEWLENSSRDSLRMLGTVGEPINPEVWHWYKDKVGRSTRPIVDTWWQTETGAIMICPQGPANKTKPGAASQPLPGIVPVLLDEEGHEIQGPGSGFLAIKYPWPSMARTIAGDHPRYRKTYLSSHYYMTGDGARRDEDGDYWITGRIDDVLNVSGHRLGTAEIESALVSHPLVAEAAVVGFPHPIKGEGIHAYVSLQKGSKPSAALHDELMETIKNAIGAIAKPDVIQWVNDLPKTRSAKIMRRILRLIASGKVTQLSELGDLSTLANPQIVEELMKSKP